MKPVRSNTPWLSLSYVIPHSLAQWLLLPFFIACCFDHPHFVACTDYDRTVYLPLGRAIGTPCYLYPDITAFLGVPFAKPPVKDLRFRPPEDFTKPYPSGVFNASEYPPGCGTPCLGDATTSMETTAEDCLYLNIWVPANAKASVSNLPVRVYIHGGINLGCTASDPQLNGCASAFETDSIQINLQYRLGAFGFLAHPSTWKESNTTSNWGLMDQALALQWVKDNIAAFGGDPQKIMLFGSSSGGSAVTLHMTIPSSDGLFSSAIAQSSMCGDPISLTEAYALTKTVAKSVGCYSDDADADLACLRSASVQKFIDAAPSYENAVNCYDQNRSVIFAPTLDGSYIIQIPQAGFASGNFSRVPFMMGLNKDEGTYLYEQSTPTHYSEVTEDDILIFIESVLPSANTSFILSLYPEEKYTDNVYPVFSRMSDIWTDIFIACPTHNILNSVSVHPEATVYSYYFTHTPSCPTDNTYMGCTHGSELCFLFGIMKNIPPPFGTCDFDESEVLLSKTFQHAWNGMAYDGKPSFKNGTVWPTIGVGYKLVTILDLNTTVDYVDYMQRCDIINAAAAESSSIPTMYRSSVFVE